jgi:hypothetical protein
LLFLFVVGDESYTVTVFTIWMEEREIRLRHPGWI